MDILECTVESFTPELKKLIYEGFRRNAIARIGVNEIADSIAFVARDSEGNIAGSIVVELFWGGLHIKYLLVEEAYRGRGVGTTLVQQALEYGQEKRAAFAFLETMSYLNVVGFYERMGFKLEFTRQGYTHSNSLHYMRKNF